MTDRYAEDIRKIVGISEQSNLLGPANVKAELGGRRGIGYMGPNGTTPSSVSGGSGSGSTPATVPGHNPNGNNNDGSAGAGYIPTGAVPGNTEGWGSGGVNPRYPNNSTFDSDSGTYDPESIIDQTGSFPSLPISSDYGDISNMTGGYLSKLTDAVDCATGRDLDIRLDGLSQPPEGWDNDGTPPQDYIDDETTVMPDPDTGEGTDVWTFTAGTRYTATHTTGGGSTNTQFPTAAEAIIHAKASPGAGDRPFNRVIYDSDDEIWRVQWDPPPGGGTSWQEIVTPGSCTIGVQDGCPAEHTPEFPPWPEDDTLQLVFNPETGKFEVPDSEPDGDRVAKFEDNQHSSVDFCFGDGNSRTGRLQPTSNGGFALHETSGGNPTGIITIFDSNNKVTGYTDPAGLNGYLPKIIT